MTEMDATNNGAHSVSSDAADLPTCAVPSCINSIPPSERSCMLHQCNIGESDCDCLPPVLAKLFTFPSELEDHVRWIKLIQREDLVNGLSDSIKRHVCCRHFPDAKPTEANPDPVLNLSPKLKSDPKDNDIERSPSPTVKMNSTNGSIPTSQDEKEINLILDDFEPSSSTEITIETTNTSTPAPQAEDETNLIEDAFEVPSAETKMESTDLTMPIPLDKNGTDSKYDDSRTSPTTSKETKQTNSISASNEPVVRELRQRRSTSRKNYNEYRKEYNTSSESGSSDSDSEEVSDAESRVYCRCGAPNTDDMIGCDGPNCEHEWFHFKCVGIINKKVPRGKWFCESCRITDVKEDEVEQLDEEWSAKLQQVCREIMSKSITIQSASQAYGFSVEVLSKHLHSKPILTTQEENRLEEMAVNMCKQGHWPMVHQSVVSSVKVLLDVEEKMGIKRLHPFEKNLPGKVWWEAFCKRHKKIQQLKETYELPNQLLKSNVQKTETKHECKSEQNMTRKASSVQDAISKLCHRGSLDAKQLNNRVLEIKQKHQKNKLQKKTFDIYSKKRQAIVDTKKHQAIVDTKGEEKNALHCLEAIIVKKRRHLFQRWFKSGDENENDLVYSAWRALKCLYSDVEEIEQDKPNKYGVPPYEGDIPPWSPCHNGPFYVPGESCKTSVSLLVGDPGKKRTKRALSRITSMKAKIRNHYLEPWRFRLGNRKALKPWKFEIKKRNRRKCYMTRRFDSNH